MNVEKTRENLHLKIDQFGRGNGPKGFRGNVTPGSKDRK